MTFTINSISLCSGTNHAILNVTIAGVARNVTVPRSSFALDPDDRDEASLARIRSAIKESGAATLAQIKTAIEGKTFQV